MINNEGWQMMREKQIENKVSTNKIHRFYTNGIKHGKHLFFLISRKILEIKVHYSCTLQERKNRNKNIENLLRMKS
jgi:hypothetical protein